MKGYIKDAKYEEYATGEAPKFEITIEGYLHNSIEIRNFQNLINFCSYVSFGLRCDFITKMANPTKVIFNYPATIVLWDDGTKTVVKCSEDDIFSPEAGLAICYMKKLFGNGNEFHKIFKKYCPKQEIDAPSMQVANSLLELIAKKSIDSLSFNFEENKEEQV